eukprot:jgi/Hompol1/429/HPOL_000146-RA
MERGQEDIYRAFLSTMRGYRQASTEILDKIDATHALLDELEGKYHFVESKTKGLQQACESLLDEQAHLIVVAEELASKLAYFNELEPITKMLSASGEAIVTDDKFGPMLQKLDQCLSFVMEHPQYKDTELYRVRYRQCMTRSMTLIKMHFADQIRALQVDIRDKLAARQTHEPLQANMQLTFFYVKFRTLASRVKHLLGEIEYRCDGHPDAFLETLAAALYNQLRPLIIRETKIDTLSELCLSLIGYQKTLDPDVGIDGESVDDADPVGGTNMTPIKFIVQRILEDAQQRLAFRAEAFIRQEIQNFKPREEELMILARGRGLPQPVSINLSVGVMPVLSESLEMSPPANSNPNPVSTSAPDTGISANLQAALESAESEPPGAFVVGQMAYGGGEWYPTLQRTLYVLGRLNGSVPQAVFEDLSQDAVDSCRISLISASETLSNKQTKLDGQLFMIKNMLMLREQILTFDAKFVHKKDTLHFTDMLDALRGVLQNSWTAGAFGTISGAIMAATATKVVKSYDDAKEMLDRELKRVCEDLVLETAKAAVEPISSFMLKANQIGVIAEAFSETVQRRLAFTVARISDYLGDKKTLGILIRIIRSFYETITAEYDASTVARVATVSAMAALIDNACEGAFVASRTSSSSSIDVPK